MGFLESADRDLFLLLNGFHGESLDSFMLAATDTKFWLPVHLFFIYMLFRKLDNRAWFALLCIGLAVLCTDQLTSSVLKPLTERLRPSHEPSLEPFIHLVRNHTGQFYRGGNYGFPSSHAANAFAVAMVLWLLLGKQFRWTALTFVVAALVGYTRIYLGVHYPGDVIVGAILGSLIGWGCWKVYLMAEQRFASAAPGNN
ncbi:MAG: phosphatase PAP2 family protein [Bacteroidota bacterium]